jgi:hypothetical protein
MKKICIYCDDEFDVFSPEKVRIGGKINECPFCVEDRGPPKYLGVAAGNGKMSDITILKFKTVSDREAYSKAWKNNSGFNKGKSCQLGNHLTSMSGMKFEVVAENKANDNHKGKS